VITVRDTGIGIEAAVLPRLFDVFAQADRTLARSRGGLGLGLALVKGLIELHQGTVTATSEGPGRGAEFTLRLPLAAAPSSDLRLPAGPARQPLTQRVLLIEDNRDAADSLRDLLELYGCEVSVAHTGPAGVEQARRTRPEVIVCDIGLPGMDGYAVASAVRQEPALSRTLLLAMSGYGQEEDQRRSREAGFDGHLVKPVDLELLLRYFQQAGQAR
jgi:two-component system CheB/CheR fusion protein